MENADKRSHSSDHWHITVKMQSNRIDAVDYLKGFSIFTIALMHLINLMSAVPDKVQTLTKIGGTGVHVFFLCSGIGLYLSYLRKKPTFPEFIRRRFSKIYIPYIIVVFLSFWFPWMYAGDDRILALLSHVFLFKMFMPQYEQSFGIQLWFVSTIMQFYLVFLPMCRVKEKLKNNKLFFGIFLALSIGWWIFCYAAGLSDVRIWNSFFLQFIWEFALGMLLAELLSHGKGFRLNNLLLLAIAVVGMGLQAGMSLTSKVLKLFNDIPALCGYLALALLLMNIPVLKKLATRLSGISYEFYLVHMLVYVTAFHLVQPQGIVLQCAVGLLSMIVSIAFAFFYHRFLYTVVFRNKSSSQALGQSRTDKRA